MLRILTAVVLLPVLWATIKLAPAPAYSAIALVVIGIACWECLAMLEAHGARPFKGVGLVAGLAVVWSFLDLPPEFGPELPLALLLPVTVVLAMGCRPDPAAMVQSILTTALPVVLVGLGLGFVAGLRAMPGEDGQDLPMLLFVCVILADIAAYYVGSSIGRRRLAPQLSPNKSWEGAIAGLAGSMLGAFVAQVWFYQRLPVVHALILGALLGAAAILGDLSESMLKRWAGVKDSSRLLPGHGGVLDRTDSLLFAGPLLFYYYRWFLGGGG
jgi:phosphatidate cytidylyltransferase